MKKSLLTFLKPQFRGFDNLPFYDIIQEVD